MTNLTFIYCVENGDLERQTILSIQSLRKYAGKHKDAEILAICPRKNRGISAEGAKILNELKVNYIEKEINTQYLENGCYNKPLVCAHAEQISKTDYLVFLDSDTIIINNLDEITTNVEIQAGSVLVKNIGYDSFDDPNYATWHEFYKLFEDSKDFATNTLVGNKEIGGYWNSGVVVVKNHLNIFKKWQEVFEKVIVKKTALPIPFLYFLDQVSLAILIRSNQFSFALLDPCFNYHISNHSQIFEAFKINDYSKISVLHYHTIFKFSSFKNPLPRLPDTQNRIPWVVQKLNENSLYPFNFQKKLRHLLGKSFYKIKRLINRYL